MNNLNLLQNTPDHGIQIENTAQKPESCSLHNSIASTSFQAQRSRKRCKRISEEKRQSVAYKKQRQKANARNRKYLAKMTDEQRQERNKKKREAYQKKKDLNLVKGIKDLTPRQQRKKRKYWREASAKYRKQKQQLQDVTTPRSQINSEPSCSMHSEAGVVSRDIQLTPPSFQKKRGEKIRAKNRARMLKEIQEKNRTIVELQRKVKTLQKSLQRKNSSPVRRNSKASPSPNKKVKTLMRGFTVPKKVRKQLLYGISLHSQLKSNAEALHPGSRNKQIFNKCISGDTLKKYKVQHLAKEIISPKQNKKFSKNLNVLEYERKSTINSDVRAIKAYFERDDISRMCPGKKDCIVRGKVKKQKRVLLGNIKSLYKKFVQENGNIISYSTFWKYKPFWVVLPRLSDRNTCLCIKHENMKFLTKKLHSLGIIKFEDPEALVDSLICNNRNPDCMLGKCKECKDNIIIFDGVKNNDDSISHFKWVTQIIEKTIKGSVKKVKVTKKVSLDRKPSEVIADINREIFSFKKHVFSAYHQITALQRKRASLKSNEIILHIDFSENYVAKSFEEIQSVHFGASKKQISIHTGVAYYLENESVSCLSFATVSNNLDHGAYAVWAHLQPILKILLDQTPQIDTIHFFSDGPTSQYRNRSNIYFMITQNHTFFTNIKYFSWNFCESGHGKGAMDGVGGSLKRSADAFVAHGNDILSAEDFIHIFQESKVRVLLIKNEDILAMKSLLPDQLPAIPHIMTIHQISYSKECHPKIFLRNLSCFSCCLSSICNHFPSNKPVLDFNVVPVKPSLLSPQSTKIPNVGEWVRVEYWGKRRKQQFVGKIMSVESDEMYEVKFLKKSKIGEFYIFPENDDTDIIEKGQIIEFLNEPNFNNRGHYIFDT